MMSLAEGEVRHVCQQTLEPRRAIMHVLCYFPTGCRALAMPSAHTGRR